MGGGTLAAFTLPTPVGELTIVEQDGAIRRITWDMTACHDDTPLLRAAAAQIGRYFSGGRDPFDLPLSLRGTAHQNAVWSAMRAIPYGATQTYGAIAKIIGSSPRAVGMACGANPLPIVIPCHRVIGAAGQLVGYSGRGGTQTKRFLLELENAQAPLPLSSSTHDNGGDRGYSPNQRKSDTGSGFHA